MSASFSCFGQSPAGLASIASRATATLTAISSLNLSSCSSRRPLSMYSRMPWMHSFHTIHLAGRAVVVARLDYESPCGLPPLLVQGRAVVRAAPCRQSCNPGHALSAPPVSIPRRLGGARQPQSMTTAHCPIAAPTPTLVACVTHTNPPVVPAKAGTSHPSSTQTIRNATKCNRMQLF